MFNVSLHAHLRGGLTVLLFLGALGLAFSSCTTSGGQPGTGGPAKEEAAQRFEEGLSYYEDGDGGHAIELFDEAIALTPSLRRLI